MKEGTVTLSRLELEVMRPLWTLGKATVREVLEALPEDRRPEYTTVQTIIYRLEAKGAVTRVKKVGNAHVFAPAITQKSTVGTLVEELLRRLGGTPEPVMAHLVESGKIGLKELRQLEAMIQDAKGSRKK
ncbi:penicillinase repressor [mine drainage metagenome]|uniref:Penicillinase repressor n=1 Tax=mine drainage metagenome TaxID=410659 RepID=A0A1J5RSZ8_9ZZZZ